MLTFTNQFETSSCRRRRTGSSCRTHTGSRFNYCNSSRTMYMFGIKLVNYLLLVLIPIAVSGFILVTWSRRYQFQPGAPVEIERGVDNADNGAGNFLPPQSDRKSSKGTWSRIVEALEWGQLVVDLNKEREMTLIYLTCRSVAMRRLSTKLLSVVKQRTDRSIDALSDWSAPLIDIQLANDTSFVPIWHRSRDMFRAVLERHRRQVTAGVMTSYFIDEARFYTDIINNVIGWVHRTIASSVNSNKFDENDNNYDNSFYNMHESPQILSSWLRSYSYLLSSINLLGAEQGLCSVFRSFLCFSHRETLYYSSIAFSGEAVFRLYRKTMMGARDGQAQEASTVWSGVEASEDLFQQLTDCRRQILVNINFMLPVMMTSSAASRNSSRESRGRIRSREGREDGSKTEDVRSDEEIPQMPCELTGQNETLLTDADKLLTSGELTRITTVIHEIQMESSRDMDTRGLVMNILLGSLISYVSAFHVCLVLWLGLSLVQRRKGNIRPPDDKRRWWLRDLRHHRRLVEDNPHNGELETDLMIMQHD